MTSSLPPTDKPAETASAPVTAARQPVPRRSTPVVARPQTVYGWQPELGIKARGGIRVVFVDDEADFLDALTRANNDLSRDEPSADQRLELRPLLATASNHLLEVLNQWATGTPPWRPDLLCIDLYEASGKGIAGTDYLKMMRDDEHWAGLPIVLTSQTEDPSERTSEDGPDLAHSVYSAAGDGYVLGKTASRAFLKILRQQFPAWRHHARTRVWRQLLEENHRGLRAAKDPMAIEDALLWTLSKLQTRLGINHAFIRRGAFHDCPVWVKVGGLWAEQQPVSDLNLLPLMQQVRASQGRATRVQRIKPDERGPFKALDGKAYMGCALLLDERVLGVMTVVCDVSDSFGPLDEANFQRLADQVAYKLGTQVLERRNLTLRDGLLRFGEALSGTSDLKAVCQALAEAAHEVVHEGLTWAKCTVRLVEPGQPLLRRYGQTGMVLPTGADIPLRLKQGAHDSMCRQATTEQRLIVAGSRAELQSLHYLDNNKNAQGETWWETQSAITVPLALDRPDSTAGSPASSALGTINLECDQPAHYSQEIQTFLKSLALTATRHIASVRTAGFAQRTLDLAVKAYTDLPDALWRAVDSTLFALLGHNLLVLLEPPEDWDGQTADRPWVVKRVFSSDPDKYTSDVARWNQHFQADDWRNTFTRHSVAAFVDHPGSGPRFTADKAMFVQSEDLFRGEVVDANAVMPLWQEHAGPPRLGGVVLLSWFSPPVMDKAMFDQVLSSFARYGALLLQHNADRQTGAERLRRAEEEATLAFAARQFEHVLNNRLAALQGLAEAGLLAFELPAAQAVLQEIREQLRRLDERAHKSALYLREPRITTVRPARIWAQVVTELADKAARHGVRLWPWGEMPSAGAVDKPGAELSVATDEAYLWNGLFVLIDNAIDALADCADQDRNVWAMTAESPNGRTILHVLDNGAGVRVPSALFQWGKSTKPNGQGVALALAKDRLKRAQMMLSWQAPASGVGACFEIRFDSDGLASNDGH